VTNRAHNSGLRDMMRNQAGSKQLIRVTAGKEPNGKKD
jgi:hypothetical protein